MVRTADGRISAFANLVAATAAKAIAIDLRRQRADMKDGTLDFCLFLDFNTAKIRAMNAVISVSRLLRRSTSFHSHLVLLSAELDLNDAIEQIARTCTSIVDAEHCSV
ncbi:MAG: hypothetical protein ACK56I_29245, partial [bacterium]